MPGSSNSSDNNGGNTVNNGGNGGTTANNDNNDTASSDNRIEINGISQKQSRSAKFISLLKKIDKDIKSNNDTEINDDISLAINMFMAEDVIDDQIKSLSHMWWTTVLQQIYCSPDIQEIKQNIYNYLLKKKNENIENFQVFKSWLENGKFTITEENFGGKCVTYMDHVCIRF